MTAARSERPIDAVEALAREAPAVRGFFARLRDRQAQGEAALITEIKKASPSAGLIRDDFDPARLAAAYESAGAACLSVLTEPDWFGGDAAHLRAARAATALPVLRKDFMVDPYQCAEARAMGADCILVILAALSDQAATEIQSAADDWGMDCLFEVHDGKECQRALRLGARLIGINNRNLKDLSVDLSVTEQLVERIGGDGFVISESGIRTAADIRRLIAAGAAGFLIGESLMRQPDIAAALSRLRAAAYLSGPVAEGMHDG